MVRISVVTPSHQQAEYLAECLASVHQQEGVEVEHIVVDGGSTDGSRELVERAADRLAWWCSEPDGGQSQALNKGLSHCTGEVFGWINSDDLLLPGALKRVAEAFASDDRLHIYGGTRRTRATDGNESATTLDDAHDPDMLFISPQVNQQSTFYRLASVRAVGGVDENLRYTMDLELWWRLLFTYGTEHLRFDAVDLAIFRLHALSKTTSGADHFRDETAAILRGMMVQLQQHDLADVLALGISSGEPRAMPVERRHIPIARRMVVYFLLKWHHTIHTRWQFEMMRHFVRTVQLSSSDILPAQLEKWTAVQQQVRAANWTAYRIRRKLEHLFG